MPPTTQQLISRLKDWCDKERGRKSEIARQFEISPQALTNWFAGRQQPTGDQILKVLGFLEKEKGKRSKRKEPVK
jgi:transcriptional regulator with XRE-family HTH domain